MPVTTYSSGYGSQRHEFIVSYRRAQDPVGGAACASPVASAISLARAFLKDAPILILDEPRSVDTRTEAAIMEAMERLCTVAPPL